MESVTSLYLYWPELLPSSGSCEKSQERHMARANASCNGLRRELCRSSAAFVPDIQAADAGHLLSIVFEEEVFKAIDWRAHDPAGRPAMTRKGPRGSRSSLRP
jgi:hypothetical protein